MLSAAKLPDATPVAKSLIPVIATRMGNPPVQEPTEEIRLLLVQLMGGPLFDRLGSAIEGGCLF